MLRSMTGYGRAQFADDLGIRFGEIKSVNHCFLSRLLNCPENIVFEERLRN